MWARQYGEMQLFQKLNAKRILFLGTPEVAANCLNTLYQSSVFGDGTQSYEIVGAVSQPPVNMKRKTHLSPVHQLSKSLSIPIHTPETAKDEYFLRHLSSLNVDLCITAAYGNYLPKIFLSIPKFGTVNIHPSLLPKYRGAAPVQRCLENGETETGVSLLFTVSKMDAGPIIKQINIPISSNDKACEVLSKAFSLGTNALIDIMPSIFDGTVSTTQQDDSVATAANKLTALDGEIRFDTMSAREIHNKCRAFSDWPGIHCDLLLGATATPHPRRVKIITTVLIRDSLERADHTVSRDCNKSIVLTQHNGKDVLSVLCGDGSELGIVELQLPTKSVLGVKDFLNGLRGDRVIKWVAN